MATDDTARRAMLHRHWEHAATDQDLTHEIYRPDAILEFPQSGERFDGVANFKAWRERYPTAVTFVTRRMRGAGDLWVVENSITYGNDEWHPTINILEFTGDKVARETVYVTDAWEAPQWRAKWRSAP